MNVLIGVPTRGKIQIGTVLFLKSVHYPAIFSSENISVQTARLEICNFFLKNKDSFSHLFFMDDDIICSNDIIEKLLAYDYEIMSANCPVYLNGVIYSSAKIDQFYHSYCYDEAGLKKVYSCGLGACLIKKEVIEKVFAKYPPQDIFKLRYDNEGNIEVGEDVTFCELLNDMGIPVYYDFNLRCDHIKAVSLKHIYDNLILTKEVGV